MKTCKDCGRNFVSFLPGQLRCQTCADIKYRAPSIVLAHETLWERTVILGFQPKWEPVGTLAGAGYKYCEKGSQFGANWAGRFDLHAPMRAWNQGSAVLLRAQRSTHAVRVRYELRRRSDFRAGTVVEYEARVKLPVATDIDRDTLRAYVQRMLDGEDRVVLPDQSILETEKHPYFALWPATEPASGTLVRVPYGEKSTLKGLGAEWYIKTIWPNDATIIATVRGGVRSGRSWRGVQYAIVPHSGVVRQTRTYISGSGKRYLSTRTVWPEQTEWVEEEAA